MLWPILPASAIRRQARLLSHAKTFLLRRTPQALGANASAADCSTSAGNHVALMAGCCALKAMAGNKPKLSIKRGRVSFAAREAKQKLRQRPSKPHWQPTFRKHCSAKQASWRGAGSSAVVSMDAPEVLFPPARINHITAIARRCREHRPK